MSHSGRHLTSVTPGDDDLEATTASPACSVGLMPFEREKRSITNLLYLMDARLIAFKVAGPLDTVF